MTLQEARNLKVGDLVIFLAPSPNIVPGYTFFTMVVDGKTHAADLGLVVNLHPGGVKIDWFESIDSTWHEANRPNYGGWEHIEKV